MKKMVTLGLAALLIVAIAMPVLAMESQFGGYWRARGYTMQNFTGQDEEDNKLPLAARKDLSRVDSRTRLYYTAILNEDLKLVNKFEYNIIWGNEANTRLGEGWGGFGADGVGQFRIKNTYVDFNLGPVNAKIGTQGATLAHGFLWDDDFSGAVITFNGEGFAIPFIWMKAYEGGAGLNARDVDYFALAPSFKVMDFMTIQPFALWATSDNANYWTPTAGFDDTDLYFVGIDLVANPTKAASMWFTGIYEGGKADLFGVPANAAIKDVTVSAWLAALGGKFDFGIADIHGEAFYATGNDTEQWSKGKDLDKSGAFFVPARNNTGAIHYWSEIMGMGIFDDQTINNISNNMSGYHITNLYAAGIGTTIKPPAVPDMSVTLDVWYAALAEDIAMFDASTGKTTWENQLGTEVDLKITYTLVPGLNLDLVGAYLFAGDAIYKGKNDANPYEIGSRLSLNF